MRIFTVPWIVWGFFKIITPFIDPVTREKLKFNEDMRQYVPSEQLWSTDWNGDMDFDYDHETYWPALNKLCQDKREDKLARWKAAGSIIGESEDYLTGGTNVSVTGFKYGNDTEESRKSVDDIQEKLEATNLEAEPAPVAAA